MTLARTSLLNGVAVVVKISCALVLNKIIAVYLGPAGYAILGTFQNIVSILHNISGGILATGVTKVTAQHFDDARHQYTIWQTALRIALILSSMIAIGVLVFQTRLAQLFLGDEKLSTVFIWLAALIPAAVANNLLLAIINGKKEVGLYVAANIGGSVTTLIVAGALTIAFGLHGVLVALCINPFFVLVLTAFLASRREWFRLGRFWGKSNQKVIGELWGYGAMGLATAIVVPVTFILIRDHLINAFGTTAAGHWQGAWKLSETYLLLATTPLAVYYLPRIAEIRTPRLLQKEIARVYAFILPVAIVAALAIYLLRDVVIQTLFTDDFLPMQILFAWQLTGDVLKIGAWVLAYVMLGRAMVRTYIVTEVVFAGSFYGFARLFTDAYGLQGVSIGYAVNYAIYWVVMAAIVTRELSTMRREEST